MIFERSLYTMFYGAQCCGNMLPKCYENVLWFLINILIYIYISGLPNLYPVNLQKPVISKKWWFSNFKEIKGCITVRWYDCSYQSCSNSKKKSWNFSKKLKFFHKVENFPKSWKFSRKLTLFQKVENFPKVEIFPKKVEIFQKKKVEN